MNVDTEVAARPAVRGPSAGAVTLTVNGEPRPLRVEPRVSLLDASPRAPWAGRFEEGM